MAWVENEVDVYPEGLVVVRFRHRGKIKRRVAFSCGYVPVLLASGAHAVAVEILYDPENQAPDEPYVCTRHLQALIAPQSLLNIEPYEE